MLRRASIQVSERKKSGRKNKTRQSGGPGAPTGARPACPRSRGLCDGGLARPAGTSVYALQLSDTDMQTGIVGAMLRRVSSKVCIHCTGFV